ncbi:sulfoxide reductase heme-binding subunit YedZ [Pseudooceanicola nitratireducens]|jgi:sulfoxide reductase heme-binding subunit YedZ|uniref:Protein-methionine-sulfoxide reductase heme-binding subunit MsrQ n=1 Tax=Pseudooceanicola nitratireducens TaxID=517719 RepID=A0A1I1GV21_9RHOB|nr:protein-methionine-sulfoxide reductase heme-binding subunit MsrQ [Pseudooceanicola nitratireducens]SEJ05672.1 sulfoxide reductase heme-binding subunit YedZ [Pseudooceanicola nitratireducens]SFC15132.1 sulfoxide reductase heme-binding subunit YedZ [Pseudooceanicola nitratireducens]
MSDSTSATPGLRDRLTQAINQGARRVPTWVLYIVGAVPPIWLFIAGLTGGLGVDPVKAMEHQMGEWALWLLIAGLCITPLRRFARINLLRFRRAIGLLAFFYIVGHLLVWLVLDVQILSQIWRDILKRPYITIGMAAFVLLIPLAVTSNNFSIRQMGARWRQLHKLVYLAAVLGAVHFVMLVKGFQYEPLIYLGVVLALLALRLPILSRRR